ncbi:MAG: hypothetical protein K6U14_09020 [Firmicutes bacterium]|nr:hypothetical protein [Alicyclobacillaceae bacterium]MCL6497752.1 hypothetical protein [Bacillota bacterium]
MSWWTLAVAAVLGLRHGAAPDHVAAVCTLVEKNQARGWAGLWYAWRVGAGHMVGMGLVASAQLALGHWAGERLVGGWIGQICAVWLVLTGLAVWGDLVARRRGQNGWAQRALGGWGEWLRRRWAAWGVGLLFGLAVSPGDLAIFTLMAAVGPGWKPASILLGTFWLAMMAALGGLGLSLGLGGAWSRGRWEPWLAGASGLFGVGVGTSLLVGWIH